MRIDFTATTGAAIAAAVLVPPAVVLASLHLPGADLAAGVAVPALFSVPVMLVADLVKAVIARS